MGGAAVGEAQKVVIKAILFVPHAILAGMVHGGSNIGEVFHKFEDHVFIRVIVKCQFKSHLKHILAEEGHPGCSVRLLQMAAGGQRCASIEDPDVIQAEETALEKVLAKPVFAVYPPGEIQQKL